MIGQGQFRAKGIAIWINVAADNEALMAFNDFDNL
jgi:hypothetical protein